MAKQPEPKRAVALKYDAAAAAAPKVVAKGRGATAESLLALARKHNVPIRQDANLARVLSRLEIDREIPAELYPVVAAVLAVLYRANRPL